MKLLGWMHRKFRQNSGDVIKEFAGGGGTCSCLSGRPSLEEDHNHRRRRQLDLFPARSLRLPPDDLYDVGGAGAAGGDQAMEELWGGLLTIGTLGIGSDPIDEEEDSAASEVSSEEEKPAAETAKEEAAIVIPAAVEAIAEKAAEATTETDLMLVTAELEKVLAEEAEKAAAAAASADRISSARPSHVGAGGGPALCPLQGFLFGSPIEMGETAGRRERRASLGELFMRSRIAEEGAGDGKKEETAAKLAGENAYAAGGDGKTAAAAAAGKHTMMKKMLKRRGSKGSDGGGALADGSTAETKFQKILQIFHKKVHPESNLVNKNRFKSGKNENKGHVSFIAADCSNGNRGDRQGAYIKDNIPSFSCCSHPPSFASSSSDSNGNREHWIKTDADYLVLEL